MEQCPFLGVCARIRSGRGWTRRVGISGERRPGFDVCRRDEELTLDGSTRSGELLYITKGYASCVTFTLGSRSDDTFVALCSLGKEGDCRPLQSMNMSIKQAIIGE